MTTASSVHEQLAQESSPCPFCGAYALCAEAKVEASRKRRRRVLAR